MSRAPDKAPGEVELQLVANLNDTSGALRVKAVTLEDTPFWAYNLEVADHHTFFVGETSAWVHNCNKPTRVAKNDILIFGKGQKTNSDNGQKHCDICNDKADELATTGNYDQVWLDRQWRTALGLQDKIAKDTNPYKTLGPMSSAEKKMVHGLRMKCRHLAIIRSILQIEIREQ